MSVFRTSWTRRSKKSSSQTVWFPPHAVLSPRNTVGPPTWNVSWRPKPSRTLPPWGKYTTGKNPKARVTTLWFSDLSTANEEKINERLNNFNPHHTNWNFYYFYFGHNFSSSTNAEFKKWLRFERYKLYSWSNFNKKIYRSVQCTNIDRILISLNNVCLFF